MQTFSTKYRHFIKSAQRRKQSFGFDIKRVAQAEPLLSFLYEDWWHVRMSGLGRLPKTGPALIVGNSSGLVPWPAFMLTYALMSHRSCQRPVSILTDMDWVSDQPFRSLLTELGFVPWSSENMKALFAANELVAIFPECLAGLNRPFRERYRLRDFDWTRLLPAIEEGVQIYPLTTLGLDEAIPNIFPLENVRKWLNLPSFNITPFFPWLPFPLNFSSFPVQWYMTVGKNTSYQQVTNRDDLEELVIRQTRFVQGEIQSELNRLLRSRSRGKSS